MVVLKVAILRENKNILIFSNYILSEIIQQALGIIDYPRTLKLRITGYTTPINRLFLEDAI